MKERDGKKGESRFQPFSNTAVSGKKNGADFWKKEEERVRHRHPRGKKKKGVANCTPQKRGPKTGASRWIQPK